MSNTLREEWAEVCAERDRLREEVAAWKPVVDAAVAFEGARYAPEKVRTEKATVLHLATDGYLRWLIARCVRAASDKPATPQPAPDVQTALVKALTAIREVARPGMYVNDKQVVEYIDAALLLAGRL